MDEGTRKSLLFREVNEKIRHVNAQWNASDAAGFFCECSDTRCNQTLALSYAEYEAMRAASDGFVILQGP